MDKVQDLRLFKDVVYRKYMLAALAAGFTLQLLAISIDLTAQKMSPSLDNIVSLHQANPLHFIIAAVPLVLAVFAHHTLRFFFCSQANRAALAALKGAYEQEKVEKQLLSEQMLSLLDLSPISYVLVDSNGFILYVNKATKHILGSSDTQGRNILAFKTVAGTPLESNIQSAIEGHHSYLESYEHQSATTGVKKILNISLIPFKKEPQSDHYQILMMTTDRTHEETLLTKVEANFFNVVKGLARALDAKDKYTSHHSANVKAYTSMIAYNIQIDPEEKNDILIAAELHDIGKIGVTDSILNKNGPLSETEYESMKTHPTIGADIFAGIDGYHRISQIIRHHHERIDGKGYPAGLSGEDIPKGSSIIAIADAFDAMTTDRIYRKALSVDMAIEELRKGAGTQFHSEYVTVFIRHFKC